MTTIQLQTLLNCCTNEVFIMYFNTFKTAISIQIAPTIKIRKITVIFISLRLFVLFTCLVHMTAVCQYCSLRRTFTFGNKVFRSVTLRAIIQTDSFDSVKGLRPLVAQNVAFGCPHRAEYDIILNYHISSNNGRPSIDPLPRIIAPLLRKNLK